MEYTKRTMSIDSESITLNPLQLRMRDKVLNKLSNGDYKTEEVNCPCCNIPSNRVIAEKDRFNLPNTVVICERCGFLFTSPRMNQSSYNEFYNNEYRPLYVGESSAEFSFFLVQIKQGKRIHDYILKEIKDFDNDTKFVLEVGCGAGGILAYFKQKGHKVMGLDIGEEYIEFGKNQSIELKSGNLESADLDQSPDLIIYSHVMEHILDLPQELSNIRKVANEKTLIYVEVPGVRNIHKAYQSDIMKYYQNAHTYHFTLTSLTRIFQQLDFARIAGNEFVRAIFQINKKSSEIRLDNEFNEIEKYLTLQEKIRPFFWITPIGLKQLAIRIYKRIKSIFQ